MARSQNSSKGRFSKKAVVIPASGKLYFGSYSAGTALIEANSTGLKLNGKGTGVMAGNTTGIVFKGGIELSQKGNAVLTGNTTGVCAKTGIKFTNRTSAYISGNLTGIVIAGGAKYSNRTSAVITGNSTGVVLAGGLKVSNKLHISANSTGFAFDAVATKPSARSATNKWAFMKSAAGTGYMVINVTGATWAYVQVTSTLNGTSGYH